MNCDLCLQDYEVDLYLRQTWQDDRLTSSNVSRPLDLNDPKLVQRIWKPEVFFANAKHAEFQYVTVPNVLVRVNPNGKILYMLRLRFKVLTNAGLKRYPHNAKMYIENSKKHSRQMNHYCISESQNRNGTNISLVSSAPEKDTTLPARLYRTSGEYSCLKADFHLQRSLGYHMVQSYLPTVLIVVISWVSFWLDVESIPARTTLGVTTLLTISSKGSGIQSNLPPVSYIKAIDVWMGACTGFVFSALLEFTVVSCLARIQAGTPFSLLPMSRFYCKCALVAWNSKIHRSGIQAIYQTSEKCRESSPATAKHGVVVVDAVNGQHVFMGCTVRAKRIDQVSRVAFPAIFLFFNSIYWPYFMCFTG
ncbi:gamma-aminobutyric acid A recptor, subunit alpha, putative [Ixodes scapularis]|uniref:Gamma-aminobutyric acid A recptor, subunit alpha, putative n=1 Tax=Ixodes scapularis TaxID=6945 RepID=B7PLP1_IXOSC|nr:gamma-aminobutyric acid A recptor, subunit alpha, putative [Ixodes scapularis]|eukprot:XP_002434689.1 gamma-aminobutyric acid A recptor, subunit alpha, putative [Ixodes scapularis]